MKAKFSKRHLKSLRRSMSVNPTSIRGLLPTRKNSFHKICGVYFLFQGAELCYVGASIDIRSRVFSHRIARKKEFDGYSFIETEPGVHLSLETLFIQHYRPKYNLLLCQRRKPVKRVEKRNLPRNIAGKVSAEIARLEEAGLSTQEAFRLLNLRGGWRQVSAAVEKRSAA